MGKDSFYFSHDYHARHDPKLAALIKIHGALGYGVYWDFVEILHEQGGKFEKFPKMYEGLSQELKLNEATLQAIISSMINDFRLLKEDDTHIWSDRVIANLQEREQKRLQKVESGRLGGILSGKKRSKTKQRLKQNEANEAKERKGKERKVKKSSANETFSNEDFIASLKTNSAYKNISVDTELAKMDAWLLAHPGRQKTRRFIINWLNKVDAPLQIHERPRV